jgi:hypothetical protein
MYHFLLNHSEVFFSRLSPPIPTILVVLWSSLQWISTRSLLNRYFGTISEKWKNITYQYSSVNGDPGFTEEAFEAIKLRGPYDFPFIKVKERR